MKTDKKAIREILAKVDHTLLSQDSTTQQIRQIIDDGINYEVASVCIPPSYVKFASEYAKGKVKICTVIGFPNGYSCTSVKCFETAQAVNDGAQEIDMVINIGWLKDKKYELIKEEINKVKQSCSGRLLKVIVETCLLTEEEKIMMCKIVSESDADFIKTSTGFSKGGATKQDVMLISKNVYGGTLIKAAGGIASIEDAADFIALGADRLGTSRVVKIVKEENLLK